MTLKKNIEKSVTKGIFITATGTDVGKTYVSALIVKKMRELGFNCGYFKPAMSGIEPAKPNDCEYVLKTAAIDGNYTDYVSYAFKPALSPHLAAQITDNPIKLYKIMADFERIKQKFDYVLVEGAGGIVCPFGENLLLPDVIKALGLDILIISPSGLGSINSSVLTVEYAKARGINVRGIILNNCDKTDFMHSDNKKQIERLTGVKVIAEVSYGAKEIKDLSMYFKIL